MKHVILHFISFLLGIAVAGAGFTYLFPQVDPKQENLEQSQPPPSHKGEPQNGTGDSKSHHPPSRPDFSPQDKSSTNSKGGPPPGR